MRNAVSILLVLLLAGFAHAQTAKKLTYQDDVLPLLRTSCLNCHNPDKKKAGLDLSSYSATVAGSDNGKVLKPGDPSGSMLFKTMTHAEEPFMPKNGDKLPDAQLNVFKNWIAAGAPETSDSKVVVVAKNDLGPVVAKVGRPDGPPPMPSGALSMEPVVRTARPGAIQAMAASPWAPLVALAGQRQIVLYQTQSLDLLGILPFGAGQINSLKFSRDGVLLVAAGGQAAKSGKAILYDVRRGKKVAEVGEEFDAILAADISPDHSLVAVGTPNKTLKAYSAVDGKPLYTVKKHTDWVTACAFSPDGVLLASGDRAGNVYVFEARTGQDFYTLSGHKDAITAVSFRDDGNVLATASMDGTVKLWSMQDGSAIKSQNAHNAGVTSIAFAHDGRLATCGGDRVTKVWTADVESPKAGEAFGDVALQCAFSDDGKRIVAGDWGGVVRVFDAGDLKRVGEITADPAGPAERLAAAQAQWSAAAGEADRAKAELQGAGRTMESANVALRAARAAKGAAALEVVLQKGEAADAKVAEASRRADEAKRTLAQKVADVARLSQEKIQLGISMENALKGGRRDLRQRIVQNEQQLKAAEAAKVEAAKPIKAREDAVAQAKTQKAEVDALLPKAVGDADAAARRLPEALKAARAADARLVSAKGADRQAADRVAVAKAALDRLKAGIAAAGAATQPVGARALGRGTAEVAGSEPRPPGDR